MDHEFEFGGAPETFYLYPPSLEKAPQIVPVCPEYYARNMKQATCFMICLLSDSDWL